MLINIRGANGSGKTTLAKSVLLPDAEPVLLATQDVLAPTKRDPERIVTKEVWGTPAKHDSIVLGTYTKSCGGCDEFSWKGSHDCIVDAIKAAAPQYRHVVFEGMTVSSSHQRYVDLAHDAWNEFSKYSFWLIIQPPVEECIRRVAARNGKQIDERLTYNVKAKARCVELSANKIKEAVPASYKGTPLGWYDFNCTEAALTYFHTLMETAP